MGRVEVEVEVEVGRGTVVGASEAVGRVDEDIHTRGRGRLQKLSTTGGWGLDPPPQKKQPCPWLLSSLPVCCVTHWRAADRPWCALRPTPHDCHSHFACVAHA